MNCLLNIGFFGNFDKAFDGIKDRHNIKFVIFEENKENSKIKSYCYEKKIEVFLVKSKIDIHKIIKNFLDIDLFLVASFGIIFDKKILNHPRLNVINIHPGILPNYRGRHPLPQAILNKEKYMGITSHIMNLEIDKGKILNLIQLPIDYTKNYKENELNLVKELPNFVLKTVDNYLNKKYLNIVENSNKYYKPLKKELINNIFTANKLEDIINENSD